MGIDQSLSHCAAVLIEDGVAIEKHVLRTGSSGSKTKSKGVVYFDAQIEQIIYIIDKLMDLVKETKPDMIVLESLSFASVGNATRTLAGLYFCILFQLYKMGYSDKVTHLAPTSIKSWARNKLPEDQQTEVNKKGKTVKKKMDKKDMIQVTEILDSELLKGYTLVAGKADIADAFILAKCYEEKGAA